MQGKVTSIYSSVEGAATAVEEEVVVVVVGRLEVAWGWEDSRRPLLPYLANSACVAACASSVHRLFSL